MLFVADVIVFLLGSIYLICSFALDTNINLILRVCGSIMLLISLLSYFCFPRIRIFELVFLVSFALYQFLNLLVYIFGIKAKCPYAICVPGAQVIQTEISGAFKGRLNLALTQYRRFGGRPLIIVCGAIGNSSSISEADAGVAYLSSQGIPSDRLISESGSFNTIQSFINVRKLLVNTNAPLMITTSNWGMLRAYLLSGKVGLNARVIGSGTPFLWYMCYSLREMFAIIYYLICPNHNEISD